MYHSEYAGHTHILNSDITKVSEGIIVHGCNAQGVMGSGVAKQLRTKYSNIFYEYVLELTEHKETGQDPLGSVSYARVSKDLIIMNCIVQKYYGKDGYKYISYDALDKAVKGVSCLATSLNYAIHVPWLMGAGLAGGNKNICYQIIEENTKDNIVYYHHYTPG